jgi:hypothetical protein
MLAERDAQIDAEEDASGQPSIWREVYGLMRCPGPPCHLGFYCWRDSVGKKYYKLKTHHLKSLIRYVEQSGELQIHEDVPEDIREQLYAEEQYRLERQQRATRMSATIYPSINITNVFPAQSLQPFIMVSSVETPASDPLLNAISAHRLVISGLRDVTVNEYSDWQQSKVNDEMLKVEFQRARDVALEDGLDFEQVYEN